MTTLERVYHHSIEYELQVRKKNNSNEIYESLEDAQNLTLRSFQHANSLHNTVFSAIFISI